MSDILKFSGILLLLFASIVFCREYERQIKNKNALTEGFIMLILHIRRQIDCYLTSASRLICGFEDKALEDCGFSELARREGISDAFMLKKDTLALYKSVKSELTSFFSGFGKDYKSGTVRELDALAASLKEKLKKEKEESEKDIKIARILAVSAAVGVAILIL